MKQKRANTLTLSNGGNNARAHAITHTRTHTRTCTHTYMHGFVPIYPSGSIARLNNRLDITSKTRMTLPSVQTRDHFCARDSLSKALRLSDILVRCRNVSGSPYPSPLTTLAYTPALPCLSGTTLQPTSAPTAAHSCDIDGITNAVPGGNYSSCDGKRSGEVRIFLYMRWKLVS